MLEKNEWTCTTRMGEYVRVEWETILERMSHYSWENWKGMYH